MNKLFKEPNKEYSSIYCVEQWARIYNRRGTPWLINDLVEPTSEELAKHNEYLASIRKACEDEVIVVAREQQELFDKFMAPFRGEVK